MNDPNKAAMFTSNSEEWETPPALFKQLDEIFHFNIDVCATKENAKCPLYFTKEENGLEQEWNGVCFCNPPYGRSLGRWLEKAAKEEKRGVKTVVLIPARTDTKWFKEFCAHHTIYFIEGRLRFNGSKENAPFPSMLVIFDGYLDGKYHTFTVKKEVNT